MGASKEVWKKTGTVFALMIVTKIIGFVKQIVVAAYYGADFHTDIYNIAYGLINSTGYAVFSALSITFLTMFNQIKAEKGYKRVNKFTSNVLFVLI